MRNPDTRVGKTYYFIQKKWLWMWHDVRPYDIDAEFYGEPTHWKTFDEAFEMLQRIKDVMSHPPAEDRKPDVVWFEEIEEH
jgi:hypothetical protein